MQKIALVILLSVSLAACHDMLNGTPQDSLDKARLACRDGVEYLESNNAYGDSFTAHLRPDGRPYTCGAGLGDARQ